MKRVRSILSGNFDIELSIIIVNWNTCQLLCECLSSIHQFYHDMNWEVIVVDNDSSDNSSERVRTEFPWAQVIESSENLGFARANNLGYARAQGRHILFLNPDTSFINDSLKQCINFYDQSPNAGLVGCRLLNSDLTLQPGCYMFPGLFAYTFINLGLHILLPCPLRRNWMLKNSDFDDILKVDWMRGAFMLISREKLERIGMFDEQIFMYGEDMDLCLRAKQRDYQNYYFPHTQIIHHGNQSGQIRFGNKRLAITFKSMDYVLNKHFGASFSAKYEFLTSLTARLKAIIHGVKYMLLPKKYSKPEKEKMIFYLAVAHLNWVLFLKKNLDLHS